MLLLIWSGIVDVNCARPTLTEEGNVSRLDPYISLRLRLIAKHRLHTGSDHRKRTELKIKNLWILPFWGQ